MRNPNLAPFVLSGERRAGMSLSAVPYTAFWCEENVVNLLAATDSHESWAVFISNPARTVQLAHQRVAEQRSDPDVSFTVLWDYHVVAVVREPDHSLSVVDRDSRLGPSVPLDGASPSIIALAHAWIRVPHEHLPRRDPPPLHLVSLARQSEACTDAECVDHSESCPARICWQTLLLIEVTWFVRLAGCTRGLTSSHQLVAEGGDGSYAVAPPAYPPIVGDAAKLRGESHNLWSRFLVMHNKVDDTPGYGYVLDDVGKLQAYLQSPDESTKC